MSYAELTLKDRSRLKRFVQEHRFADAMKLFPPSLSTSTPTIVDFGAGNGELSMRLSLKYPKSSITCYEPGDLLQEAKDMVGNISNITTAASSSDICSGSADVVYCLEVFEHLPDVERQFALDEIHRILKSGGWMIVGVPIEIGLPALPKGLFRMARRRGDFDARIGNILRSTLGRRFSVRPSIEIAAGLRYHPHHTGFDYRKLRHEIIKKFQFKNKVCSPFALLGPQLNSEIYLIASKK